MIHHINQHSKDYYLICEIISNNGLGKGMIQDHLFNTIIIFKISFKKKIYA